MFDGARQKTILVIDDTPADLDTLVQALSHANFRVRVAESGQYALQLLHDTSPDIILLDVQMPGLDGFETCRQIKAMPELGSIPILFVAAGNESNKMVCGFDVGGVDYLRKPIDLAEALARINNHLRISEQQLRLQVRNKCLIQERQKQNEQLQVATEAQAQIVQESQRLSKKYEKLFGSISNQSNQVHNVVASTIASQNQQRQAALHLFGEQIQENLIGLRFQLDAAHNALGKHKNHAELDAIFGIVDDLKESMALTHGAIEKIFKELQI